jgi:hypothetical protein
VCVALFHISELFQNNNKKFLNEIKGEWRIWGVREERSRVKVSG